MKKFNINDYMYIQITEKGWEHLKNSVGDDYIKHCIDNNKVIIDGEVWHRLQVHNVFDLLPTGTFKSNVMFDNNALKD